MERDFTGKVVVITGAGSGIGRSTALLFARLGAKVHVVDVDAARADAVRAEIEATGARARAHEVDCSDPDAVERLADAVFSEDGAVDVLHNNAGIGHAGSVDDTTLEDWQRVLSINLMATVYGVHAFVPRLLAQGRPAHIVNTASMAGLVPAARMAPYCTSKFAVVGLSESLAAELAPRGIGVSAICPGIIDTAIVRDATMRGDLAGKSEKIDAFYRRRGASPDVVAESVVDAVLKKRLIVPVPRSHVVPPWLLERVSPRLSQFVARATTRFVAGRDQA